MSAATALLIAIGLLGLNGFFVAAEFALLASRRSRIEQLAADGNRAARSALAGIRELSLMLAGAQLGITMCSLGLGIVAEPAVADLIEAALGGVDIPSGVRHAIAFTIALSVVVFLHMVVGEMAPKSWAIAHPEESALALARPFRAFARLFRPVILGLNAMSNGLVRAVGVEPQDELAMVHSPADLALLLHESRAHGLLDEDDHGLLARTLALRDIDAEQAMTPRRDIISVDIDADGETIERVARETGRSRLLITDASTEFVGAVHVKDALVLDDAALLTTTAGDLLRPVQSVVQSVDIESVMQDLRTSGNHVALVIDEYGSCIGMLTLEDVLEELIGDFADESDVEDPVPMPDDVDGVLAVPGGWRIDELGHRVGVTLPEGDYHTLAGYMLHELGRIPAVGDEVRVNEAVTLIVREMDGTRITQVSLARHEPAPEDDAPPPS
ncbi:MAG TPA: hemolysin family protein [Euzebya sp.]|nr:hemolysin family protein [Euzebya sp.]